MVLIFAVSGLYAINNRYLTIRLAEYELNVGI